MTFITAHITDMRGVYLHTLQIDPKGAQPAGAVYETDADTLPKAQKGYTRIRIAGAWQQVADELVPKLVEPPSTVPQEVLRYCGVLALKRHRLVDGELQKLGAGESWDQGSLYAQIMTFRANLPAGELRDKLDVALNDVLHWMLTSPTLLELMTVLGLTEAQRDQLFIWAQQSEATL